MLLTLLCLGTLLLSLVVTSAGQTVPYDSKADRWLLDLEDLISQNDVVYTTPSPEPWEAMPTGGGDLSAMVRFDGDLHLHLTKSDAWGFQAPPDAPPGSRFFNNVSPGHICIGFGEAGREAAARSFRQRLDLYHGRIVLRLGAETSGPTVEVWGHPTRKILVVEVTDPGRALARVEVELSEWRPAMRVGHFDSVLYAREVQERPARPHLANTGMEEYLGPGQDPLQGRGTAVVVSAFSLTPEKCVAEGSAATMSLPKKLPPRYHFILAAAVTPSGDPLAAAKRELEAASRIPLEKLKAEHQAWWREFWSKSFLHVESPDRRADWLCAAYHVHLYTLACVNRGQVPAKWDGGAGLMRQDERNWGLAEWVQEIRFTFLPLYAANHLDIAKGLPDHYSRMVSYLTRQTEKMWGLPGLWIPETVLPWGHAEDFVLSEGEPGRVLPYMHRWKPEVAPYGRFGWYNPYVGFLFTAGLEVCHHYLTYYRYTCDETFLRKQAYPVLRGVCEFLAGLARREQDGRYHLDPANALETWWMVRDPADTLAGLRAIFPEFIRLSQTYRRDADLRRKCADILAALPEQPRGLWREDGTVAPEMDVYAPAYPRGHVPARTNAENPALYAVFPFALSGLGAADYDRSRRTFDNRICPLHHGWSMDAIWAARLGLGEEACALLFEHARRFNRFRYGGWDSNDSNVFPGGLAAAPFLDAGGLSAFGLQEVLLQSHNNLIRVCPAVARNWSGVFRLRAEGGFTVATEMREGRPRFVEVASQRGGRCRVANPWSGPCLVRHRREILLRSEGEVLEFSTQAGEVYTVERADSPLSDYQPAPLRAQVNQAAGLRGRDF